MAKGKSDGWPQDMHRAARALPRVNLTPSRCAGHAAHFFTPELPTLAVNSISSAACGSAGASAYRACALDAASPPPAPSEAPTPDAFPSEWPDPTPCFAALLLLSLLLCRLCICALLVGAGLASWSGTLVESGVALARGRDLHSRTLCAERSACV